jgi:hypothetical protein
MKMETAFLKDESYLYYFPEKNRSFINYKSLLGVFHRPWRLHTNYNN